MKEKLLENKKKSTRECISDSICHVLSLLFYVDNDISYSLAGIFRGRYQIGDDCSDLVAVQSGTKKSNWKKICL